MKILFFDMEFANGKIPGSIYSFGYVQTNGKFALTQPQTDLLMNPECNFNDYVRKNILAYPMKTVKEASTFPAYYKRLKKLLCRADLAVGFAVGNDTVALLRDCERYGLKPPIFKCLDMERLCKKFPDHQGAHGLSGCVEAWCGTVPEHQHRSDGDAYATMLLFRAICQAKKLSPKAVAKKFPDCLIPSVPPEPKKKKEETSSEETEAEKGNNGKKRPVAANESSSPARQHYKRRRRHRRYNGNHSRPAADMREPQTVSEHTNNAAPKATSSVSANHTETTVE